MTKASDLWPVVTPPSVPTAAISSSTTRYTTYSSTTFDTNVPPIALTATWNTSSALNTARQQLSAVGGRNSTLCFGGYVSADSAVTEIRSTSSWSTSGALNTARTGLGGAGITSAALSFGGYVSGTASGVTETFNGSTWTNVSSPALTARGNVARAGIQNAALSFGGWTTAVSTTSESFNGTVWSTAGTLNSARYYGSGVGVQGSALALGGYTSGPTESGSCEVWNGIAWSAHSTLPMPQAECGSGGVKASAIVFGTSTRSANTSYFDGTSWLISASMALSAKRVGGCGSAALGACVGGFTTSNSSVFQLYDGRRQVDFSLVLTPADLNEHTYATSYPVTAAGLSLVSAEIEKIYGYAVVDEVSDLSTLECYNYYTFTVTSASATIGAVYSNNSVNYRVLSTISGGSSLICSGPSEPATSGTLTKVSGTGDATITFSTLTYKSSATNPYDAWRHFFVWATANSLSTGRFAHGQAGVQKAMLAINGYTGIMVSYVTTSEYYNGSSWSQLTASSVQRAYFGSCGFANAALMAGGRTNNTSYPFTTTDDTSIFNGVAWSSGGGTVSVSSCDFPTMGCVNAAVRAGGRTGDSPSTATYYSTGELYNGSAWSSTGSISQTKATSAGCGKQNSSLIVAGFRYSGGNQYLTTVELFNGSTWSTSGAYPWSIARLGAGGRQNCAIATNGYDGAYQQHCASFNGSTWVARSSPTTSMDSVSYNLSASTPLVSGGSIGAALTTVYLLHYASSSASSSGTVQYGLTNYTGRWLGNFEVSIAVGN